MIKVQRWFSKGFRLDVSGILTFKTLGTKLARVYRAAIFNELANPDCIFVFILSDKFQCMVTQICLNKHQDSI